MNEIVYLLGSFVVGVLLIADNVILIRRRGVMDTVDGGKAVGLTRFFMLAEAGWIGASLIALTKGTTLAIIPALYLAYSAMALTLGTAINVTEGPVRSLKTRTLKVFLTLGCVFTLVTIYQIALVLGY